MEERKMGSREVRFTVGAGLFLLGSFLLILALFQQPLLSASGHFLSIDEPLAPADAVLVSYATDRAGVHQAANLYFAGYGRLIVLSNAKVDMPGVAARNLADLFRLELLSLGVPDEAMVSMPEQPTSTAEEAGAVKEIFARHGVKSAILVTATYRMRRSLLSARRSLGTDEVRLLPSPVKPPDFDLDRWWETRAGISAVLLNEYPRLLYYWLRGRL